MIIPPTLQDLLDEDTPIDVIYDAIIMSGIEDHSEEQTPVMTLAESTISKALLSTYRYRGIGCCDVDRFERILADRLIMIYPTWKPKILAHAHIIEDEAYDEFTTSNTTASTDSKYYDAPDTPSSSDYLSSRTDTGVTQTTESGQLMDRIADNIAAVPEIMFGIAVEFKDLFWNGVIRC